MMRIEVCRLRNSDFVVAYEPVLREPVRNAVYEIPAEDWRYLARFKARSGPVPVGGGSQTRYMFDWNDLREMVSRVG